MGTVGRKRLDITILMGMALLSLISCAHGRQEGGRGSVRRSIKADDAAMWKVTWSTDDDVDPGSGRSIGRNEHVLVVTPTEIREWNQGDVTGQPHRNEAPLRALSDEHREAVSALLPRLRGLVGVYSLGPEVDDEGSHSEMCTVELRGEVWCFEFMQGSGAPPMPAALGELARLLWREIAPLGTSAF